MENLGLNKYIDHTLLKPGATKADIETLCSEAIAHNFAAVCVNPVWIKLVASRLESTGVIPCTVISFPLGADNSEMKAAQTINSIALGAKEIDMVMNIGAAKEGDWAKVERDIETVVFAANAKAAVKVIIETDLLTENEKVEACLCAKRAGAAFVKTSTGFIKGGATLSDVRLMRNTVGEGMGVKASGGICTKEDALKLIEAGASRIGTSAGVAIITK